VDHVEDHRARLAFSEVVDSYSEIGHFSQKCSGRRPLLPLNALKGQQNIAQGKRGARSPVRRPGSGFRPILFLSPKSPAFGRFGGEAGEGASSGLLPNLGLPGSFKLCSHEA
jgi:hypothetical protein